MKEAFECIMHDPALMEKYNADPIAKATLFGLYDYVCAGNKLEDLPWFALTKFARREQEKHLQAEMKKAA